MLDDSYDYYPARVTPNRRQRQRAQESSTTYDYADHPYDFDGDACRCGRPFEEHEEAGR